MWYIAAYVNTDIDFSFSISAAFTVICHHRRLVTGSKYIVKGKKTRGIRQRPNLLCKYQGHLPHGSQRQFNSLLQDKLTIFSHVGACMPAQLHSHDTQVYSTQRASARALDHPLKQCLLSSLIRHPKRLINFQSCINKSESYFVFWIRYWLANYTVFAVMDLG